MADPSNDPALPEPKAAPAETKAAASFAAPAPVAAVEPAPAPMSLQRFCARLSSTVRSVELVSAFHSEMSAKRILVAPDAEFRAAFDAFAKRPTN